MKINSEPLKTQFPTLEDQIQQQQDEIDKLKKQIQKQNIVITKNTNLSVISSMLLDSEKDENKINNVLKVVNNTIKSCYIGIFSHGDVKRDQKAQFNQMWNHFDEDFLVEEEKIEKFSEIFYEFLDDYRKVPLNIYKILDLSENSPDLSEIKSPEIFQFLKENDIGSMILNPIYFSHYRFGTIMFLFGCKDKGLTYEDRKTHFKTKIGIINQISILLGISLKAQLMDSTTMFEFMVKGLDNMNIGLAILKKGKDDLIKITYVNEFIEDVLETDKTILYSFKSLQNDSIHAKYQELIDIFYQNKFSEPILNFCWKDFQFHLEYITSQRNDLIFVLMSKKVRKHPPQLRDLLNSLKK